MRASRSVLALALLAAAAASGLTGCASAAPAGSASAVAPLERATGRTVAGRAAGFQDPAPTPSTSRPTRIRIPGLRVDSSLEELHRDAEGGLETPQDPMRAGWYADGTAPGQVGPAVIAGHLDGTGTAGVFAGLHRLRTNDRIVIERADGTAVRFTVTRTETVSRFAFPAYEVYGPTRDPELRLITCAGAWDAAAQTYSEDLIVFATAEP